MEQNKHDEEFCSDDNSKLPSLSAKYPWFVVQNLQDLTHQFFSTLHNPSLKYQCRIPELSGRRIQGCFHGWIILSNHPHNDIWSLWNPSSNSRIISLPPLILKDEDYDSIAECCLSAPPDDPNSVILLTRTNKPTFVFCQLSPKRIKSLRKKPRWTEMSYAYQLKRITWDGLQLHSLTCCNGQVYALCTDNQITHIAIEIAIIVKDREVVIQLLAFGACPTPLSFRCFKQLSFLTATCKEMFYIIVGFHTDSDKIPYGVYLFKLEMTSVNWEDLECLKHWDMTRTEGLETEYCHDLKITHDLWEEVKDLKDGIFVVDLTRENLEFYNPVIASELGGYIHIQDKMDKVIYSYQLNNETISASPVPSFVLPTSHMSMWECRLEDDHKEAKFMVDSKQGKDEIVGTLITDNDIDVIESKLLDFPFDVLEMIMKFCVGVEYLNFRATCKRLNRAAPVIQWRNQVALHDYSSVSPWLMVVDQIRDIITFTDPMMGDNYFMRSTQLLSISDETIYYSRFGWLLFTTSDYTPAFFNPFTNDLRLLPKTGLCMSTYCFSHPPTSPDCMVVGFAHEKVLIHYVAREPSWHLFDLDTESQFRSICYLTFHETDLYALYETGELMVFKDLGEEDISWEILKTDAPRSCSESPAQYFLVKGDQHLLLVVMGSFGKLIEVFKLNDSTQEWEKVNGLGRHMIYLCDTTCLCIEAKTPEMENKIFLAQLSSGTKKIVFYSLETCTFHTFNGKSIQKKVDIVPTRYVCAHTWIEPSWSLHYPPNEEEE
uniref:uncharacterized protein LOC122603945 n=1 Tax=Erigeron canadensis TaxID=72917 RepID=UPI001CB88B26|nr:uncharacterized protein LOC122603945 [Erigeron canadensis]XP_043632746.1 uncharacterized protein LOC122603945 [Erigeron canadensis]